jgi:hypothetical protein
VEALSFFAVFFLDRYPQNFSRLNGFKLKSDVSRLFKIYNINKLSVAENKGIDLFLLELHFFVFKILKSNLC